MSKNDDEIPDARIPATDAAAQREQEEFSLLVDAHFSGTLDDVQARRLRELLLDRPVRQDAFLLTGQVHGALTRLFAEGAAVERLPQFDNSKHRAVRISRRRAVPWLAALAASVVAVRQFAPIRDGDVLDDAAPVVRNDATGSRPFATWVGDASVVWEDGSPQPTAGSRLAAVGLELREGVGKLRFDDGTVLHLEAPARLDLLAVDRVFLHGGNVTVRMPKGRRGFVVDTASVNVLDQGTEFAVGVEIDGGTFIQVFDGEVQTTWKTSDTKVRLTAGDAVETGPHQLPRATTFAPQRFVRELPVDQTIPAGRPSIHTVRSHAFTTPPTIDGDLADWNSKPGFHATAAGEFREHYAVSGVVGHDAEFLYVAANVADPTGLRNMIDPAIEPESAWRGGALHIRLSSDASLGWPVDQESEAFQTRIRRNPNPSPCSDRLFQLLLWYYRPERRACLHVGRGLGRQPSDVPCAVDFRGAYRSIAGGYSLEYAIPWRLLLAEGPPADGRSLAMCWQLHWSIDGRAHRGYLLEVCNPSQIDALMSRRPDSWIWHRTAPWGRLWFGDQPPPDPGAPPPP